MADKLTESEFSALAKLLRSRDPAKTAARIVLVEGRPRKDAMALTGASGPSVSQAVRRFREAHLLVLGAYKDAK